MMQSLASRVFSFALLNSSQLFIYCELNLAYKKCRISDFLVGKMHIVYVSHVIST